LLIKSETCIKELQEEVMQARKQTDMLTQNYEQKLEENEQLMIQINQYKYELEKLEIEYHASLEFSEQFQEFKKQAEGLIS